MEDTRVWEFEESLWAADADRYREAIDDLRLMVVPAAPFVLSGSEAVDAVSETPRSISIKFSNQRVARPQEGLIVVAYHVEASNGGEMAPYNAWCTSTYRRLAHEKWTVVQHQQTPSA